MFLAINMRVFRLSQGAAWGAEHGALVSLPFMKFAVGCFSYMLSVIAVSSVLEVRGEGSRKCETGSFMKTANR